MTKLDKANYRPMNRSQLKRIIDQLLKDAVQMHDLAERNAHIAFIAKELRLRFSEEVRST